MERIVDLVVGDGCTILWLHLIPMSGAHIMLKMIILCYVYFIILKSLGGNILVKAVKDKRDKEII